MTCIKLYNYICYSNMFSKMSILWLFLLPTSQSLLTPKLSKKEEGVIQMLRDVTHIHFKQTYCVGIISQKTNLFISAFLDVPIVLLVLSGIPEMNDLEEYGNLRNETAEIDRIMVQFLDQQCTDFIVHVSHPEYLVKCFSRSSRRSSVRSTRRYLYLPFLEDSGASINIKPVNISKMFSMKEMKVMPDLVVIKFVEEENVETDYEFSEIEIEANQTSSTQTEYDETIKLEFITHKFSEPHSEEEIKLGTWMSEKGFLTEVNLFPNKIYNLGGKKMGISAVPDYPPYTILDLNSTSPIYEGVEFRVTKDYARWLNFSFYVLIDDEAWWGEVWPNGTGNGMWGMVAMDMAVLGFGATYAWLENYPYLDYSLPYYRSSVRCITPRPQQLPGWMTPILPFNRVMWFAVGLSLLVTIVSLYVVTRAIMFLLDKDGNKERRYYTWTSSILWAWGLLLLQTPVEETAPKYVPLRHLMAWLLVYFMLVNTVYSGGLSSVLTVPRFEDPINSVEDLANSDMMWAATLDAWIYSIQEETEPNLAHIVRNYRTLGEEELLKLAFKGHTAFAVERLQGGNYALPSYINDDTVPNLRAMREDIYHGFPVFNIRKSSPFLESLNTLVLRLQAAGLLLNYEVQVVRELVGQRIQLALANNDQVSTDSGPVRLQIAHIQGPLFFLGFGLLAGFFVFISEVMRSLTNKARLRRNMDEIRTLSKAMKALNTNVIPTEE